MAVGIGRMNVNGPADAGLEEGQIVSTHLSNSVQAWVANADHGKARKNLTVTSHMAGAMGL